MGGENTPQKRTKDRSGKRELAVEGKKRLIYIEKNAFIGKESKHNNLKLRDTAKEDIKFLIRCCGKGDSKSAPLGERRSTPDYGENWNRSVN